LDSYANMAVVGKEVTLISDSGLYAEVRSFSNYVPTLQNIPIVDAVVSYDDLLDEDAPFACSLATKPAATIHVPRPLP